MEDLTGLFAIACLFVILPGMMLWYFDRQRRSRREESTQQPANADLLRIAERMERRIDALERILDTEAPGWRNRHHG